MAAKLYRIVPVSENRFKVEVWIGWTWLGSWEQAHITLAREAIFTNRSDAENFILTKRAIESQDTEHIRAIKRDNDRKFQAENPPYEFP